MIIKIIAHSPRIPSTLFIRTILWKNRDRRTPFVLGHCDVTAFFAAKLYDYRHNFLPAVKFLHFLISNASAQPLRNKVAKGSGGAHVAFLLQSLFFSSIAFFNTAAPAALFGCQGDPTLFPSSIILLSPPMIKLDFGGKERKQQATATKSESSAFRCVCVASDCDSSHPPCSSREQQI